MSPWDFLGSINESKKNLFKEDPLNEKDYSAFMVNRGLSYFPDTIMYANEMNLAHGIPKEWQYEFYLNAITKKRRFSKWSKQEKTDSDIQLISKVYGYSYRKAAEIHSLIGEENLKQIRSMYHLGGR